MRVIAGAERGITLKTPEGLRTRPTAERVKEGLFSAIQFEIPGTRVLDLFAGTGQLGIEALSRGARDAVFVDMGADACRLVRENLQRTGLTERAQVVQADYLRYLERRQGPFGIIFLDPPYAEVFLENALEKISEIDILANRGIIVTERPVGKELPCHFPGLERSRDYKYGKTLITIFRKKLSEDAE